MAASERFDRCHKTGRYRAEGAKKEPFSSKSLDFNESEGYIQTVQSHEYTMTRHCFLLVVVLLLFSSASLAGVIDPQSLRADDVSNGILLHWNSVDESSVAAYTIERKAGMTGPWVPVISRYTAKGNGQVYEIPDETAFRTSDTAYQYHITAVNRTGGVVADYYVTATKKSISSVRRTWGSIKAMFR